MVTLLYKARTNGVVCRRIAEASKCHVRAICDKTLPDRISGTLIRWDSRYEVEADDTINSVQSVILSRNKSQSRTSLAGLCPPTWFNIADLHFPCILRPRRHYGGRHFFVCRNRDEASWARRICGRGWYASPIIDKAAEYRVFLLQGRVVGVSRKYPHDPSDLAWNAHQGGHSVRLRRESWPDITQSL